MHTLVIIGEGFDLAVEKTRVDDIGGWMESQVKDLGANRNDWHDADVVRKRVSVRDSPRPIRSEAVPHRDPATEYRFIVVGRRGMQSVF